MYTNGNADMSYVEMNTKSPLYKHVAKTYAWMFLGLLLTFLTCVALYATKLVIALFITWWLPFALLVAKLALVVFLTARLHKMSVGAARGIFLGFSVLTGVTLSPLMLMYEAGSAIFLFGVAALFFGVMAGAGLVTKRDVSGFAPIVLFGLIALVVMELVSLFIHMPMLDTVICFIGIAIFLGVTTYDAKKCKDYYHAYENDAQMLDKVSIFSALNLYLDFINLFLYLLRLLGKRR